MLSGRATEFKHGNDVAAKEFIDERGRAGVKGHFDLKVVFFFLFTLHIFFSK